MKLEQFKQLKNINIITGLCDLLDNCIMEIGDNLPVEIIKESVQVLMALQSFHNAANEYLYRNKEIYLDKDEV